MIFPFLPPEVNSGLIYSGPGSGSMLAAAAAWDNLAAELQAAATSYSSVVGGLAGDWTGPSSMRMTGAAEPYAAWMHTTALQAEEAGSQAKVAAAGYETARAASVPPPAVAANRTLLAALVATNFLGQNTPAIAATEAQYEAYWVQDVLAMLGYAGTSQTATNLSVPNPAPEVANPGAQAMQAAAVTPDLGSSAASAMLALPDIGSLGSLISGLGTGGFQLPGELAGLQPILTSLGLTSPMQALNMASTPARFAMMPLNYLMRLMQMGNMTGNKAANASLGTGASLISSLNSIVQARLTPMMGALTSHLSSQVSQVTAHLGHASTIGSLKVPQGWTAAAPALSRAAPILPEAPVAAAPLSSAGMPGGPFGNALMGALTGRGIGSLSGKITPKVMPRPTAGG